MKQKIVFERLLDGYLFDDGFDRDICVLGEKMGILVGITNTDDEYIAITKFDDSNQLIVLNKNKIKDNSLLIFILAYQLAELIKSDNRTVYSTFMIDSMDYEIYQLAKLIFDRSNKYKKKMDNSLLVKRRTVEVKI